MNTHFHSVIIVGAGPGGLSVAAALQEKGISDILVLDKGSVGQSWLDYPPETHLLSESSPEKDENMIAGISVWDVCTNISHPSHEMYQKYLQHVVDAKKIPTQTNIEVTKVTVNNETKHFFLETTSQEKFECQYLVWSAGMFATPNEDMDSPDCFLHYSRIQNWEHLEDNEIYVIGSANGATEVVLQVAKPGRKVFLLCSRTYDIPEPIDCLWKENMQLVKNMEKQGLVDIIENFRTKTIHHHENQYEIESSEGQKIIASSKPILCIGFSPTIGPVNDFIKVNTEHHEVLLDIDDAHQSKQQPNLYFAGTIGKKNHEDGFIRGFRFFGEAIANDIQLKVKADQHS